MTSTRIVQPLAAFAAAIAFAACGNGGGDRSPDKLAFCNSYESMGMGNLYSNSWGGGLGGVKGRKAEWEELAKTAPDGDIAKLARQNVDYYDDIIKGIQKEGEDYSLDSDDESTLEANWDEVDSYSDDVCEDVGE